MFSILAALIYLSYGGGFGTMPATAADFFGTPNAGAIYGAMIVAWSIGGIVGPLIAAAAVRVERRVLRCRSRCSASSRWCPRSCR